MTEMQGQGPVSSSITSSSSGHWFCNITRKAWVLTIAEHLKCHASPSYSFCGRLCASPPPPPLPHPVPHRRPHSHSEHLGGPSCSWPYPLGIPKRSFYQYDLIYLLTLDLGLPTDRGRGWDRHHVSETFSLACDTGCRPRHEMQCSAIQSGPGAGDHQKKFSRQLKKSEVSFRVCGANDESVVFSWAFLRVSNKTLFICREIQSATSP